MQHIIYNNTIYAYMIHALANLFIYAHNIVEIIEGSKQV